MFRASQVFWYGSVVTHLAALVSILLYLAQSDLLVGHHHGPPRLVFAAMGTAAVSLMAMVGWLVTAVYLWCGRSGMGERKPGWWQLSLLLPSLLSALILAVALTDLPRARAGLHRQRVAELARQGPTAVPELIALLDDDDWTVRQEAAFALGDMGADARAAVPALIEKVTASYQRPDSANYLLALRRISEQDAVALLAAQMQSPDGQTRVRAADDLWKTTDRAEAVVPILSVALRDSDAAVRQQAADVLARIGPSATAALPALLDASKDADAHVRLHAAEAMWKVEEGQAAVACAVMVECLRDKDTTVPPTAARMLCALGPMARDAVPNLIAILKGDNSVPARAGATEALGGIGAEARLAVPVLVELLKDNDPSVRFHAREALRKIDPQAASQAGVK